MDIIPHHITVSKTARYYTFGEISASTRDIWIVCHGYRQLASRFLTAFSSVGASDRVIVAPEALSRFYLDTELPHTANSRIGATWMTREDRDAEIGDIVLYLDAIYDAVLKTLGSFGVKRDEVRINGLGFSQGGAAVSRWIARGRARVDRLVMWGSAIPADIDLRALADRWPLILVDFVYGVNDPAVTGDSIDTQRMMLKAAILNARIIEFDGGHIIDKATLVKVVGD